MRATESLLAVIGMFSFWKPSSAFVVRRTGRRLSQQIWANSQATEWSTDKVRATFVQFFEKQNQHTYVPSSACAPLHDPTLLFTNAGMNQFKPVFLGQVPPGSFLENLRRACNSQKCIRAGGKHNDLDDVGRDTYHHTFFEMLGSWSFGDYFKKEAIHLAWDLLTNVYKLDKDRLYATYFEGNDQVPADLEARDFWLQYLPEDRVLACGKADNFWEMGDTGPCGPCTEIHYDRVGNRDAAPLVNQDDPDVIEIWNVVFIQYNQEDSKLQELPSQHVDTGMGLERLVSILQGKTSNYDIDVFEKLFDKIAEHSKIGPYTGTLEGEHALRDTAYRAIADHARTLSFAIADGAVPNNEGRGYVLRRILRRATRYGQQVLGAEPGFFATLVPVVVEVFGDAYPELKEQETNILEVIKEEETAFSTMLDRGIKHFEDLEETLQKGGKTQVSGNEAFFLYDTLGFPLDLTELMAEEAGLTVDVDGFAGSMKEQKERSRAAQKAARGGSQLELIAEQTAALKDSGVLPTDDSMKFIWDIELPATVQAIFTENGFVDSVETGESCGLVVDKSTFYAEAGGQQADSGIFDIMDSDGTVTGKFVVEDVQVFGGYILHKGVVESGKIATEYACSCNVDYERRRLIAPNHSMTHVLNSALRQVLGDNVDQRGSLCNEEKLRFDFSYKKAMKASQLKQVEEICQKAINDQIDVTSDLLPLDEAKKVDGVRAVFGEVYPDPVRVVRVGDELSVEFCGGTHIGNTADAEAFVLVEETAVAKGIRRVTGLTKDLALAAIKEGEAFQAIVDEAENLSGDTADLDKRAARLRKDLDAAFLSAPLKAELRTRIEGIQKKAVDAKKKALQARVDSVLNDVKEKVQAAVAAERALLVLDVDIGADSKSSQKILNAVKKVAPELAFLGLSEEESGSGGKLLAFASVPDSLVEQGLKADEWIRTTLESCGGRGGGRPTSAQGQAQSCEDVAPVLLAANQFAESKVGATVA